MNNKRIAQDVQSYVDFMTKFTVRIISFKDNGKIGHRSGFLYQPDESDWPIIITAGHGCPTKGSFVETRILKDGQSLCYNAGEFKVFFTEGEVDLAYSKIPFDIIRKDLSSDQQIEYKAYKNKFHIPSKGTAYGFAGWNNYEAIESGQEIILPQYCCHEVGMEFHSLDHWQYLFKTHSEQLKEDEYYDGASGSPITDPEGRICSILLGRTDDKKYIRGLKLPQFENLLNTV